MRISDWSSDVCSSDLLALLKAWGWSEQDSRLDKLNVNGSGISLGHPIGDTGARIAATMLSELRRRGARYGLETMGIGGGQGLAAIFERGRGWNRGSSGRLSCCWKILKAARQRCSSDQARHSSRQRRPR